MPFTSINTSLCVLDSVDLFIVDNTKFYLLHKIVLLWYNLVYMTVIDDLHRIMLPWSFTIDYTKINPFVIIMPQWLLVCVSHKNISLVLLNGITLPNFVHIALHSSIYLFPSIQVHTPSEKRSITTTFISSLSLSHPLFFLFLFNVKGLWFTCSL